MLKHHYNALLHKVNIDILQASLMLDQTPVYEYACDKEINVVFVGEIESLHPYLSLVASTAQILDKDLKLHIVADESECKETLLASAPLLEKYSNLGNQPEELYVSFLFHSAISEIKSVDHRYAVVVAENTAAARSSLKALVAMYSATPGRKAAINYICPEECSIETPKHISINHLNIRRHKKTLDRLGEMAFRLHYLYTKANTPTCSRVKCREEFLADEYGQTSSLASVLHCKYKLYSIGINPRSPKANVIKTYNQTVFDGSRDVWNSLIYLEHRRWMVYTMFAGYNNPTAEQLWKYSYINGNYRWRSDKLKLHNCLVPCARNTGFALQALSLEQWEKSEAAIEKMGLDPLDQMSMRIHGIAKKKMEIARIAIDSEFRTLQTLFDAAAVSEEVKERLELFRDRINSLFKGGNLHLINDFFEDLRKVLAEYVVPGESNLLTIRNHLRIVEEFYSYHDFKLADRPLVDDLLFILYANKVSLIKLIGSRVLDNIAAPLIMEPENLVYVGPDGMTIDEYTAFFKGRGDNISVSAHAITMVRHTDIAGQLGKIIEEHAEYSCVIDVTGADPMLIAAAVQIAQNNEDIGIVCSDAKEQRIINILNFSEAHIYREKNSLSTSEAYGLFGAIERPDISKDNTYLLDLINIIPKAWKLYQAVDRKTFESICGFLSHFAHNAAKVTWKIPVNRDVWEDWENDTKKSCTWVQNRHDFANEFLKTTNFYQVLSELENFGLVRNLSSDMYRAGIVQVRYEILHAFQSTINTFVNEMRTERYEVCSYETNDLRYGRMMNIGIQTAASTFFKAVLKPELRIKTKRGVNRHLRDGHIIPGLNLMSSQEIGLIRKPSIKEIGKANATPEESLKEISFNFIGASNDSVRAIFDKTGTILELYVWLEAKKKNCFHDIHPNFGFYWGDDSHVSNELDLILTHKNNLQTAVVSCKTSAIKLEHIYEVLYLAERFSLNTKAAIIYTQNRQSTEAYPDGFSDADMQAKIPLSDALRKRIKAMGVELIILEELGDRNLGDVLENLFL